MNDAMSLSSRRAWASSTSRPVSAWSSRRWCPSSTTLGWIRIRSPSKSVTMSSSSTSKPRSLRRSIRCSIRHISSAANSSSRGQLVPQLVVALLDQRDDLVALHLRAEPRRRPGGRAARRRRSRSRPARRTRASGATASGAARRSRRRRGTPRSRRRCGGTARSTATRRPSRSRPGAAAPAARPARRPGWAGSRPTCRGRRARGRGARTRGARSSARRAAPRPSSSSRPVTTPSGLHRRQAEPLEVAQQAVLPERDLLLGLLDGVGAVAEPDDADDVAAQAAGKRDDVVVGPLLERASTRAGARPRGRAGWPRCAAPWASGYVVRDGQ